jgi:Glycosyltransferase family 87
MGNAAAPERQEHAQQPVAHVGPFALPIPRADIAIRLTLLGIAIAVQNLLEAPRGILLGVFGERGTGIVLVLALAVSLALIARALLPEPPRWRWLSSRRTQVVVLALTLLAALFGLKSLGSIAVAGFNTPYYPNDGTTLDHFAAQELLRGHNPYVTTDIVTAIHEFQQDPTRTTPLARGAFAGLPAGRYPSHDLIREVFGQQPIGQPDKVVEFETHVSYPALSFLPLVPFVWAGFPSVVVFYAICLLLLVVALVASAPAEARPWIALLALASAPLLDATLAGSLDVQWILLMYIAWRWSGRSIVSTLALGLAIASKQLAWFILPYYAIYIWQRYDLWSALTRLGGAAVVFLAVNAPFIISNSRAWLDGVLAPQLAPMFPSGTGLVRLSLAGVLPLFPQAIYAALELATLVAALVWYWRRGKDSPEMAFMLAVLPLFFAWRSLTTYFYYVGLPALTLVLARRYGDDPSATAQAQGYWQPLWRTLVERWRRLTSERTGAAAGKRGSAS